MGLVICLGEAISILPVPVCYIDQETVPLDGEDAVLVHTRYFPEGAQDLALPCILIRTPYGREFLALSAARFASRGYCVIAQDCRGRSQGSTGDEFIPVSREQSDGVATLKWIEQQPFCSGSIGMFGMSYLGICQVLLKHDDNKRVLTVCRWLLYSGPSSTMLRRR